MAAAPSSSSSSWETPGVYKHHEKRNICISRPKYREGRRDRAVKVYTINLESRYLMIQGVPAIGVMTELIQLCALYGTVEEYRPLDEYPAEEFTEVYLVKFQKLTSARAAKRHMDEKSFYGGVLHVCYVPEYESVEDTRFKLLDRRRYVMRAAQNKAREKAEKETGLEEPTTSNTNTAKTSESITPRNIHRPNYDDTGPNSTFSHHSGFPLLPLPPQEQHCYRGKNQHGTVTATEDKMGTLHDVVLDSRQQQAQGSSSSQTPPDRERETEHRPTSDQATLRFVPRKTHLENRKRTVEEAAERTLTQTDVSGKKEPLFGPKLPEAPKLDMEDESLNTTVTLIRNTMKQVGSVPDVKPEVKKKQRRRI